MPSSRKWKVLVASAVLAAVGPCASAEERQPAEQVMIQRGRYLVRIAGCNDCHTPRYAETGGNVPEAQWLIGSALGWHGPWGTTYATNLRLYMQGLTEEQWVETAKTERFRPPMPWMNLHAMTEKDLRAIYRFIRYLGPAGEPAPAYLPPGQTPEGPHVAFPMPPAAK